MHFKPYPIMILLLPLLKNPKNPEVCDARMFITALLPGSKMLLYGYHNDI